MNSRIEIFDSQTIDRLDWRGTEAMQRAKRFLLPLIKSTPQQYVENARAKMFVLAADSWMIPLVVSNPQSANSDICSPYSHYISYPLSELSRGKPRNVFAHGVLLASAPLFRVTRLDQVVYANNWLLTTNPSPHLSSEQVSRITSCLIDQFPDHAIVFPTVNPLTDAAFYDVLRANKYKMVPSRTIHLFKPSSWAFTHYHNLRRDRDLLNTSTYQVIGPGEISEEDLLRITELYRALYLGKYTPFNPQYNERFFSLVVRGDFFVFRALKDEQVDAFVAYYLDDHGVTASLIGYDTTLPIGRGLYRQAFALFFREVGQRGEVLNLSAGAASFKEMRGSIPCVEYYAVFDSHLPFYRRIAWHLAWAGGLFQHATVWRWNRNKSRQARTASLRNLPG